MQRLSNGAKKLVQQLPKLNTRVRFPSPAPNERTPKPCNIKGFGVFSAFPQVQRATISGAKMASFFVPCKSMCQSGAPIYHRHFINCDLFAGCRSTRRAFFSSCAAPFLLMPICCPTCSSVRPCQYLARMTSLC